MRVFICVRSKESCDGAVIIAAKNEAEAVRVYGIHETYYNRKLILPTPYQVKELPALSAVSFSAKVIYDDYSR